MLPEWCGDAGELKTAEVVVGLQPGTVLGTLLPYLIPCYSQSYWFRGGTKVRGGQ